MKGKVSSSKSSDNSSDNDNELDKYNQLEAWGKKRKVVVMKITLNMLAITKNDS